MGSDTRVYIVAAFEPLRFGLVDIVREGPGLQLAGSAATFDDATRDLESGSADVGLVDYELLVDLPVTRFPFDRAVFVDGNGGHSRDIFEVLDTMPLTAMGVVDRNASALRLGATVRLVAAGAVILPAGVAMPLLRHYGALMKAGRGAPDEQLSERELQVAQLVARGLTNKEIARTLTVAEGTVKAHVSHIMAKLGLSHRSELTGYILALELTA